MYLALADKYDRRDHNGEIYYRSFQDELESLFVEKHLEKDPSKSGVPNLLSLGTVALPKSVPIESEEVEKLIVRIRDYCSKRGIKIREAFLTFDRINRGQVTTSQVCFYNDTIRYDMMCSELQCFDSI